MRSVCKKIYWWFWYKTVTVTFSLDRTGRGTHSPAAFTQRKIQVFDWMVFPMYRCFWYTNTTLWHWFHTHTDRFISPSHTHWDPPTAHFFSFFCAAFFFTSCKRFMALSWDSWDVGALSPGAAFDPFPLFPLPPPLLPPLPPALAWELLGEPPPDEVDPFPWPSPLDERFNGCLPRVRGGGGFRGTWLEPFPLPLPGIFEPPSPDFAPASPDSPTGFWPEGVDKLLWLPLGPEEPSLELAGRDVFVLAPNAAQPVRPLPAEVELLLVGLADVVDAWNDKKNKKNFYHNYQATDSNETLKVTNMFGLKQQLTNFSAHYSSFLQKTR